jgi:hypothetical protein
MEMKVKSLLIVFSIALMMSCEESESPYSNVIRLLTNNDVKIWVTTSVESTEDAEGINCFGDDILSLQLFDPIKQEPTFRLDEGFVRCSYNDDESSNGTWRLNNAQTRIILTYGEGSERSNDLYDIIELTERRLVLRNRNESFYDLTVTIRTITYESL